ncbi:MAG: polysaccharide deacetylase family protein [Bacteroidota bacterium]
MENGKFVISLDFELLWGMRDIENYSAYEENIVGVHTVIPRLLETFTTYDVKATFAIVGFLFFENKDQLIHDLPSRLPGYTNQKLSPYRHFDVVKESADIDLLHFAPKLIKLIQQYPSQEIGTHTFSHYYCLEAGQSVAEFEADLQHAQKIAGENNIPLYSLVFPRNQFQQDYLDVCSKLGITSYRGNERSWMYEARNGDAENFARRALRLLDSYVNISGHNCYPDDFIKSSFPRNIPASRFLRPYEKGLEAFDKIKLDRITSGMTYAAKKKMTYHLWWHPHNFGINQDKNFSFLEQILSHYTKLNARYNFQSYTMSALVNLLDNG